MSLKSTLEAVSYSLLRRWTEESRGAHPAPNCILVLQYMLPLGVCVHATPLFEALHKGFPQLPVYVATRGLGAEVLRHNPYVAGLLITGDVFTDFLATGRALREQMDAQGLRPAWIITDASNRRSKIALLGVLYGRGPLAGFSLATALQRIALEPDSAKSMLANNLAIAGALGASAEPREPCVFVSAEDIEAARALLAEVNLQQKPVVVFATQPSGGQPTEWRDACWGETLRHVSALGFLPVFAGTVAQSTAIDRLRDASGVPTASLAGQTDVPTLAAVLGLADACISIDTGTLHVARAAAVPVVALAPTYQSPVEWLPLGLPTARVIRGPGTAPVGPDYRLDEIEPPDVIAAFDGLMREFPPEAESREARVRPMTSTVDHLPAI